MEASLVSIIPTLILKIYPETIQSVRKQTYRNWEIILVDDCSSDNTVAITLEMVRITEYIFFSLKKFWYWCCQKYGGFNAKGRYFLWMRMIYGNQTNYKDKLISGGE
jgi:cellulose synthase/poly-beta-1,6-N-acetylglucosamine synthase-like glycosyltransferase